MALQIEDLHLQRMRDNILLHSEAMFHSPVLLVMITNFKITVRTLHSAGGAKLAATPSLRDEHWSVEKCVPWWYLRIRIIYRGIEV